MAPHALRSALAFLLPACTLALRVGPILPNVQTSRSVQSGTIDFPAATDSSHRAAVPLLAFAAVLAITEPASAADTSWVAPTKLVLGPLLSVGTVAFLMRVVLSWFPSYNLDEPPWNVVAVPTEPFLKPTRLLVPPVAGVDISPIIWVAILSFLSEILLGPQGLLTIIAKKG
mmetsp:Transcript_57003/g.113258  ORF Transcript_57003/g.113258 Transcript_57003/m.113258 type:complete len:172 (-) Transcript_57003:258-773(-)|eukprot:CAMPEP_0174727258 /NCGR_PEP_ID=MMETSP1094-20130205/49413_1 /TAXON_ID=156173 /ORGANISM="Chrysochromulina brevifilum, Strain UTEX LB 985" /LENGTH=171 /DNA_ID=CAMNT_0015928953 /DNA_START=23 /DNA_END=538 /DNA_ORIENTATION=-